MEEEKIEQGLKSIKQIMDLFLSGLVSTDEKAEWESDFRSSLLEEVRRLLLLNK